MSRSRRSIPVLTWFAVSLLGQSPIPQVQVSGFVRSAAAGRPLGAVQVTLSPGSDYRPGAEAHGVVATTTASDGSFSVNVPPGPFMIHAAAAEYLPVRGEPVFVDTTSTREVIVLMVRKSTISGRIVDSLTGNPILGMQVTPSTLHYQRGQPQPFPSASVTTDRSGRFRLPDLVEGDYVLRLAITSELPKLSAGVRLQDAPASITGYGEQWWPNGSTPFDQGVRLAEGENLSVPDIRLPQRPLLQVGLLVKPDQCDPRDRYRLTLFRFYGNVTGGRYAILSGTPGANLEVRCGTPLLIDHLSPGEYDVEATLIASDQNRARAAYEHLGVFTNQEWIVQPRPGVALNVSLELPDGFPDDVLQAMSLDAWPAEPQTAAPGRFVASVQPDREVQLSLRGLPPRYYISRITYEGTYHDGTILMPKPQPQAQTVTLAISAGAATIRGTVQDRSLPVPGMVAVAVPTPIKFADGFPTHSFAPADDRGRFLLTGLAPGTYRVLAVSRALWDTEIQKPGVLGNFAVSATEVQLGPGADVTVTLEPNAR